MIIFLENFDFFHRFKISGILQFENSVRVYHSSKKIILLIFNGSPKSFNKIIVNISSFPSYSFHNIQLVQCAMPKKRIKLGKAELYKENEEIAKAKNENIK